jgi:CubicO group peptidase (beta-lactamase class C family)
MKLGTKTSVVPRILLWIVCCAVAACGAQPQAQTGDLGEQIDEVMSGLAERDLFSGCVLVAQDGEVLYAKPFGEANKDHHVANTLDAKFNIGSIGKTFTGVAIMQLVERGEVEVSDPVSKYLDDFPHGDQITIHHLLTHTSGLFSYFAHPDFPARMHSIRSVDDALPLIYDQDLLFDAPGERFAYSNSGIVVLGAVIEAVTGQSYASYIEDNILKPAGMDDTGINYWDEVVENRASGYIKTPDGGYESNVYLVPPANADGGIETTVGDLLKFDQALYGEDLLSEESKEMMFTPFKSDYGYCWMVEHRHGNRMTGHSGGAPGVSAMFRRYLDDRYSLIVLSNYDGAARGVAGAIEDILFSQD